MTFQKELSCGMLYVNILRVGEDCQILLSGGSRPHIGCTVLAFPRPSLSGDGHTSATSSVLNVTGHKDEAICRYLGRKSRCSLRLRRMLQRRFSCRSHYGRSDLRADERSG